MARKISLAIAIILSFSIMMTGSELTAADDLQREALLDVAFEKNDLNMAVLLLIKNNNIPVSDVILKAREKGFGYTQIVDALVEANLSREKVIIAALQNGIPPKALFNSDKICGDKGYTPESILAFLVKELNFIIKEQEAPGKENKNAEVKQKNLEIILGVCKSLIDSEGLSQYAVIKSLCDASATVETVTAASKRLGVPMATTLEACQGHAEFGHAYISSELPQEAYIIIGVDHLTIEDDAGNGTGQTRITGPTTTTTAPPTTSTTTTIPPAPTTTTAPPTPPTTTIPPTKTTTTITPVTTTTTIPATTTIPVTTTIPTTTIPPTTTTSIFVMPPYKCPTRPPVISPMKP